MFLSTCLLGGYILFTPVIENMIFSSAIESLMVITRIQLNNRRQFDGSPRFYSSIARGNLRRNMANNFLVGRRVVTFLDTNRFKMNFFAWFLLLGNKEWGCLF